MSNQELAVYVAVFSSVLCSWEGWKEGRKEGEQDGGSVQISILTTDHRKSTPEIIVLCFCAFFYFEHTGGKGTGKGCSSFMLFLLPR